MARGRYARKRPKGTQSERSLSARVSNPAIHPPTARGLTDAFPAALSQPSGTILGGQGRRAGAWPISNSDVHHADCR
jgi:hypothetical protein